MYEIVTNNSRDEIQDENFRHFHTTSDVSNLPNSALNAPTQIFEVHDDENALRSFLKSREIRRDFGVGDVVGVQCHQDECIPKHGLMTASDKRRLGHDKAEQVKDELRERNDYVGQRLVDHDFSGQDLRFADFEDATLINPIFKGANLEDADFFNARLENPDFTNANLRLASFYRTDMVDATFRGAGLGTAGL